MAGSGESAAGSAKLMTDISVNGLNVAANLMPEEGTAGTVAEVTKAGAGAWAGQDIVRSLLAAA